MLTSNTILLQRFEGLKKQLQDTENEIVMRIKDKRSDNDGYIIHRDTNGKYGLVSREYFVESLINQTEIANKLLQNTCGCKK